MGSLNAPIGIFDSGFGGLTVARAVTGGLCALPDSTVVHTGHGAATASGAEGATVPAPGTPQP